MDSQAEATEHLRAIRRMMEQTRQRGTEDNWIPFVIWGIGGLLASLASQVLTDRGRWDLVYIPWNVYWPAGLLLSVWLGRGRRHSFQAGGFIARAILMTWTAVGITMLLVSLAVALSLLPPVALGVLPLLAGAGCFVTAAMLQERLLYAAGALWWIGGLAMMARPGLTFAMLALLFGFGYLLPAYLMKRRQPIVGELADAAAH
jgi:hypothetical protein